MNRQTLIELLFDVQLQNITVTEAADLIEGDKKLHDADVIEAFAVYYLAKTGSNIGFRAEEYARQLRNSVNKGK